MERGSDRFDLAAELAALRAGPDAQFAAYLDARAAAGFPRGGASHGLIERLHLASPRGALATAGACAVVAVAIATTVLIGSGGDANRSQLALRARPARSGATSRNESLQPPRSAPRRAGGTQANGASEASSAGSAVGLGSASARTESLRPFARDPSGPYASRASRRDIERSARIVIGADPSRVRADSGQVFDAVHAAHGIVLDSSIREGEAGEAGAAFDLLIPSAKLSGALADLSAIGEIRSRHESTADITAPTASVGERLQDVQARIESLLAQLAATSGEGERISVEARLRTERARGASLRSRLNALRRRASFSRVSVRIETGEDSSSSGGAGWGIDDGIHAAGRVLTVAAGVIVVGLAVLVPLALALLLATLAYRAWLRRARQQILS